MCLVVSETHVVVFVDVVVDVAAAAVGVYHLAVSVSPQTRSI